jgi:hypothetical protein
MTKITPDHLARGAFVYVRQSTAMQVTHNLESQRRQYGLADRARQLGWQDVEVIDDDLGRSGGGARRQEDLPEGARFVPKPYSKFEIAVTFRELLAA